MGKTRTQVWDPGAVLEALGASETALWIWEPDTDRLRFTGAAHALGLASVAPECPSAAMRALVQPSDRAQLDAVLEIRQPGSELTARLQVRGSRARRYGVASGSRRAGAPRALR